MQLQKEYVYRYIYSGENIKICPTVYGCLCSIYTSTRISSLPILECIGGGTSIAKI